MIHTTEKIGDKQALTPEGFLLCRDVPIARTGVLLYGAGEIPADPDENGFINVSRDADEVFKPEAIASFEGKPVTNLHPDDLVSPENWQEVSVGTVSNVRQEGNLLVADLLIMQADAINDVQNGLREVSCGYEADYEQTQPGFARQVGIVGNHVALVPKGRCGSTCSIKDHDAMKPSIKDRLMAAFRTKDEATIKATLDSIPEEDGGDVHIHMSTAEDKPETKDDADPMEERLSRIEAAIAALSATKDSDENGDDDEDSATADEDEDATEDEEGVEKYTGDSAKAVMSKAAIIAPAFKPKATNDAKGGLDAVKRSVLAHASTTDAGAKIINSVLAGRSLKSLKGVALGVTFDAVAAMMAHHNNTKDSEKSKTADTIYSKGEQLKANIAAMRAARTKQF
ncbi:MAG: DUF2213 domain-containing protein [Syntrophomonadaceae bacterium]|nr:DUF2213 domain-containing protein [Syntrophomonadaceae bacterium]